MSLLAVSSAGRAADADLTSPTSVYDWTGFYGGLHVGYRDVRADAGNSTWGAGLPFGSLSPDGAIAGLQAGYDFQVHRFVFGLRGDLSFGEHDANFAAAGPVNWQFETGTQGSLRGRAGYAFDSVLPYVTAGVSFVDTKASFSQLGLPATTSSTTLTGWTLGAGVEYGVNDWLSLNLDYAYSDYGKQTFRYSAPPLFSDYDVKSHTLTFGTNLRF